MSKEKFSKNFVLTSILPILLLWIVYALFLIFPILHSHNILNFIFYTLSILFLRFAFPMQKNKIGKDILYTLSCSLLFVGVMTAVQYMNLFIVYHIDLPAPFSYFLHFFMDSFKVLLPLFLTLLLSKKLWKIKYEWHWHSIVIFVLYLLIFAGLQILERYCLQNNPMDLEMNLNSMVSFLSQTSIFEIVFPMLNGIFVYTFSLSLLSSKK